MQTTALADNICVATQTSLDRFFRLAEMAQQWRGAISVSVFLDGDEVTFFRRLVRHLQHCHDDWLSQVAFHIVSSGRERRAKKTPSAGAATASGPAAPAHFNCTSPMQRILRQLLRAAPSLATKWETGTTTNSILRPPQLIFSSLTTGLTRLGY